MGKSDKELRGLRREIDIMRGLHHDNIIEMLDSFDTDKEVSKNNYYFGNNYQHVQYSAFLSLFVCHYFVYCLLFKGSGFCFFH